jgi:hypothetical protein
MIIHAIHTASNNSPIETKKQPSTPTVLLSSHRLTSATSLPLWVLAPWTLFRELAGIAHIDVLRWGRSLISHSIFSITNSGPTYTSVKQTIRLPFSVACTLAATTPLMNPPTQYVIASCWSLLPFRYRLRSSAVVVDWPCAALTPRTSASAVQQTRAARNILVTERGADAAIAFNLNHLKLAKSLRPKPVSCVAFFTGAFSFSPSG